MFDMDKLNQEIAEEIEKERKEAELSEFAPPTISQAQVNGAKYAWMAIAFVIDAATAYALLVILAPYWWYAILWIVVGVGGLVFAEWLWERVGNNDKQMRISRTSKNVAAVAVVIMALVTGIALVIGVGSALWVEALSVLVVISLACFHAWQAYQYHEVDDDYIALNLEAKAEASNLKEIRGIHRAGRRIEAKKRVHLTGAQYQRQHGDAFAKAAGKSFASTTEAPKQVNPTGAGEQKQ